MVLLERGNAGYYCGSYTVYLLRCWNWNRDQVAFKQSIIIDYTLLILCVSVFYFIIVLLIFAIVITMGDKEGQADNKLSPAVIWFISEIARCSPHV